MKKENKPNVLCICAVGVNRSKYLAKYLKEKGYPARFGGIDYREEGEYNPLKQQDVDWADVIVIVRKRLVKIFNDKYSSSNKKIIILDVTDTKDKIPQEFYHLRNLNHKEFQNKWTYPELRKAINPYLPLTKNPSGHFIIIRGPLGCGKSTISEKLSKELKAKHISVDKILEEHNLTKDKEDGYISQKSFFKANEIAIKEAKPLLEKGKTVIFDGNFYWKSQVDDLISKLDFPHKIFTLKAPLKICIQRDSKRKKPHGKIAALVVHNKTTSFDYGIKIDATKPIKAIIKEIKSYLKI